MRTVKLALRRPLATLAVSAALLVGVIQAYGTFGNGVEFFPDIEPDYGLVQVRARGDLSIPEKDNLVRQVEDRTGLIDEAPNYVWSAALKGKRLSLAGHVPNEPTRKAIIGAARATTGSPSWPTSSERWGTTNYGGR